jgi:hypothetical protein
MKLAHLAKLCKGFADPSRSVAHVRGKFENFGDILVADAIEAMFPGLCLVDCGLSRTIRWLDSLIGVRRLFRYSCLGGGTIILAPDWLRTLNFVCSRTTPLFTMGTGVIDPEFVRSLYGSAAVDRACIRQWIECLEQFRFVSVRGVESQRILAEHGFDRATVIGDPALFFARETFIPKRAARRIGVNVSSYSHFWGHSQDETIRILSELISWLVRQEWMVTLFPSMPEDYTLSRRISDALNSRRIKIFGNYADREGLLDELAVQDLFVGVKLHTVIAACCVATPAIMIGYQPKCLDFMRTMNLEGFHIRSDRLDLGHLIEMIEAISSDLESVQRRQSASARVLRGRLIDFRDQVVESLGMLPALSPMSLEDRAPNQEKSLRW